MIYAYDLWAQMPVKDLYDSQMMMAAIAAAKDQYDTAKADMKEFNKEYGDFIAGSDPDLQWYNNEFDIKGFVNDLYARGEDPLRTQTGRTKLAQYIASRDYATFNNVRRTAEVAKEYNKNKEQLRMNNLYNPTTEALEGVSPEQWDTAKMGKAFDRYSPTPYQNMATFSAPYFNDIEPILSTLKRNGITYNSYDITEKDLHNIADRHFNDLVNTAQGQLMYKMYLLQSGDPVKARLMFNNAVVSGNLDRIRHTDDYTKMALEHENMNLKRQQLALSKQIAQIRANGGKRNNGIDENDTRTPWINKFFMSHQLNRAASIVGNPAVDNFATLEKTLTSIVKAYDQMLVEESKKAGMQPKEGRVVKEATPTKYALVGQSSSWGPVSVIVQKGTPEQRSQVYSKVNTKAYKDLKNQLAQIKFVIDDIRRVRDIVAKGKTDDASMRLLGLAQDRISKYVDAAGMPTALLENELAKTNAVNLTKVRNDLDLINYANKWYSNRQNKSTYDQSSVSYQNLLGFIGAGDKEEIPALGVLKRRLDLNRVLYSPLHRINVSGGGNMVDKKSIMKFFLDWMTNTTERGILWNENLNSAAIENKNNPYPQAEAFGYALISPRQFDIFYGTLPQSIKRNYNKKEAAAALGLVPVDIPSKENKEGNVGKEFENQTYYNVPITGILDTNETLQTIEMNDIDRHKYQGASATNDPALEDAAFELLNLF